jgi:hypothetical protein
MTDAAAQHTPDCDCDGIWCGPETDFTCENCGGLFCQGEKGA